MCNSLSRNKGVEKGLPLCPSAPACSVGHSLSSLSRAEVGGGLPKDGCSVEFELWGQERIQWSSVIRSLAYTQPRPLRGVQCGLPTVNSGFSLLLPGGGWVASSPSLPLLFVRSTYLSCTSPPPQLLSVGKCRSFLLLHLRNVGESGGRGNRRNMPISVCIEVAPTSP